MQSTRKTYATPTAALLNRLCKEPNPVTRAVLRVIINRRNKTQTQKRSTDIGVRHEG